MKIAKPISRQPLPSEAKKVFSGVVFDVYQWEVKAYDGSIRIFEKLKRADTTMVVAVTEEQKIMISYQEHPNKKPFYGLLGGGVEAGEDPLVAAKRELLEESGYSSDDWSLLDAVQPVSKLEWAVYTFVARNCKKVAEQSLDGAEKIELKFMNFEEFIDIASRPDFADLELRIKVLEAKADQEKMTELKKIILDL